MSNLANIATIAAALIALAALSLQYMQARRAHKRAWLRLMKRTAAYVLLLVTIVVAAYTSYLGGEYIVSYVAKDGFATRLENVLLILNFINVWFYGAVAVALIKIGFSLHRSPSKLKDENSEAQASAQ
ncbi:hypothetical protein [Metapseudomonas otitidis]|uniref:hypothetical protein n=1 Tax=Metapseudomonas otitidis TaxID=319939 RepID=UPI0015FF4F97|nr:hypothetical protein [Pseudomonas otitidis]